MDVHNKSGGFVEEGDLQLNGGMAYWLIVVRIESFDFMIPLNVRICMYITIRTLLRTPYKYVFDQCVALLQATESNP